MRAAGVLGQETLVLDNRDGSLGEEQPQVRFLGAAAAIATNGRLDLWCPDFKYVGSTVAAAPVSLQPPGV